MMTRVTIGEDCGNSPKNIFVQELTIAFARADSNFILSNVTEDIRWNIIGDRVIRGKKDFAQALQEMNRDRALELTIHHIATHGKVGAVDGILKFKNGKTLSFCDVYEFSNAKGASVKEVTSYWIESR